MNITPQTLENQIVAYRSNGRRYHMTFETFVGEIEIEVSEKVYRRASVGMPVEVPELDAIINDMADAQSQSLTGIPMF